MILSRPSRRSWFGRKSQRNSPERARLTLESLEPRRVLSGDSVLEVEQAVELFDLSPARFVDKGF